MRNHKKLTKGEKMERQAAIVTVIGLLLIAIAYYCSNKPVETNINAYVPEGYHSEFTSYKPEWGETLTESCDYMIDRYQMEDFITTYEYINVVMDMNHITDDKSYQADTRYFFPYIITDDVVG